MTAYEVRISDGSSYDSSSDLQPRALFQPAPKVEDRRVHIADLSGGAEAAVRAGPFSRWLKKGRRDSVWNAPRPESGGCSSKRNSSFRPWLSPSAHVTSATDLTRRRPFAMLLRWTITWIEIGRAHVRTTVTN